MKTGSSKSSLTMSSNCNICEFLKRYLLWHITHIALIVEQGAKMLFLDVGRVAHFFV